MGIYSETDFRPDTRRCDGVYASLTPWKESTTSSPLLLMRLLTFFCAFSSWPKVLISLYFMAGGFVFVKEKIDEQRHEGVPEKPLSQQDQHSEKKEEECRDDCRASRITAYHLAYPHHSANRDRNEYDGHDEKDEQHIEELAQRHGQTLGRGQLEIVNPEVDIFGSFFSEFLDRPGKITHFLCFFVCIQILGILGKSLLKLVKLLEKLS